MQDSDADDIADVDRVLAGDVEAFSRLVDRHGQAVHQQMRSFSRDRAVSEELAHEVFVEAYLSLSRYRKEAPFRNWLARIATFTGYKYWRNAKKAKIESPFPEGWDAPAAEESGAAAGDPEAAVELLHAMLAALPDKDRLLLTLAYVEDCSYREIAERLEIGQTLVPMRVFKAKLKLKRLVKKDPWKGRLKWMVS